MTGIAELIENKEIIISFLQENGFETNPQLFVTKGQSNLLQLYITLEHESTDDLDDLLTELEEDLAGKLNIELNLVMELPKPGVGSPYKVEPTRLNDSILEQKFANIEFACRTNNNHFRL